MHGITTCVTSRPHGAALWTQISRAQPWVRGDYGSRSRVPFSRHRGAGCPAPVRHASGIRGAPHRGDRRVGDELFSWGPALEEIERRKTEALTMGGEARLVR